MGRVKMELSDDQVQERKDRWWGEQRNARRRQRYKDDPEYRERVTRGIHKNLVKKRGIPSTFTHLGKVKDKIAKYGQVRKVTLPDGSKTDMLVLTTEEVANLFDRDLNAIYRWRNSGKFPEGVMTCVSGKLTVQVYSVPEIKAIVGVLREHFRDNFCYHSVHFKTKEAVVKAVTEVRHTLKLISDEATA